MSSKKQMYRKKALLGVLTLFIFLVAFLPTIKITHAAADDVIAFYDLANNDSNAFLYVEYPTSTAVKGAVGNSFLVNGTRYVTALTVEIVRVGSPDFTLKAAICAASAQAGTNVEPDAMPPTVLAQSDNYFTSMSISTSITEYTFTFNQTYALTDGVYYCWFVYVDDYVFADAANCVKVQFDSSSSYGDGNYIYDSSSAWAHNNTYDTAFYLYGNVEAASSGSGGSDDSGWWDDAYLAQLGTYIVTFVIILLPSIVLGLLFHMGKWGYIIGIIIGSGLGYILFPTVVPLWIVFLVGTGVFAMILLGRGKT